MSLAKYYEISKVEILNTLAYPYNLFGRGAFIALIIFIFFNLWSAIYNEGGANALGFSLVALIWYLVMAETAVNGGTSGALARRIAEDVQTGDIAYTLNRPYSFLLYQFAYSIGTSLLVTIVVFALASIVAFLLVGPLQVNMIVLPFVVISLLLALVLMFLMNFSIGILAFWFEEVKSIRWINEKLIFILGGMLIPINFFPGILRQIALLLPFSYTSYAPAYLFVDFSSTFFVQSISMQLIWIAIYAVVAYGLYRIGIKRVSTNGG
jgi:ABC-2 type transport system permease protein